MVGRIKYLSKICGECADDIGLTEITNENEKKFVIWCKVLEDTVTSLILSVNCYEEFIKCFVLESKIFNNYNTFLINYISNLCTSISIEIGKLCSEDNELSLYKLNKFCKSNNDLFKNCTPYTFRKCRDNISKLNKLYKEKMHQVRNKIYAHNDELLLDYEKTENALDNISFKDLRLFVTLSEETLSKLWKAYNNHKMCFRTKGFYDYRKVLNILKKQSGEN